MSHTGTSSQSFSQSAMLCCQFIISKGISSRLLVPLVGHGRLVSGEGGDFCQRPFPSTSSHPSQLTSALLRHFGSKSGADKSLHGDSAICKSCCGRRVFSPPSPYAPSTLNSHPTPIPRSDCRYVPQTHFSPFSSPCIVLMLFNYTEDQW